MAAISPHAQDKAIKGCHTAAVRNDQRSGRIFFSEQGPDMHPENSVYPVHAAVIDDLPRAPRDLFSGLKDQPDRAGEAPSPPLKA